MYIFNFSSPLGYRELVRLGDMIKLIGSNHFKHCVFFDPDDSIIEFGFNPDSDLLYMVDSCGNVCYVGNDGSGESLFDIVYCPSCGYEWRGDDVGHDDIDYITCVDCIKILHSLGVDNEL